MFVSQLPANLYGIFLKFWTLNGMKTVGLGPILWITSWNSTGILSDRVLLPEQKHFKTIILNCKRFGHESYNIHFDAHLMESYFWFVGPEFPINKVRCLKLYSLAIVVPAVAKRFLDGARWQSLAAS